MSLSGVVSARLLSLPENNWQRLVAAVGTKFSSLVELARMPLPIPIPGRGGKILYIDDLVVMVFMFLVVLRGNSALYGRQRKQSQCNCILTFQSCEFHLLTSSIRANRTLQTLAIVQKRVVRA